MAKSPKPAAPPTPIPELVKKHVRSLQSGKRGYKKADAALADAVKQFKVCESCNQRIPPAEEFQVGKGKYRIVDKLKDKATSNVGQNFRQYDVEEQIEP